MFNKQSQTVKEAGPWSLATLVFSRDVQPTAAFIILMGLLPVAARAGSAHEHMLETFAEGRIQGCSFQQLWDPSKWGHLPRADVPSRTPLFHWSYFRWLLYHLFSWLRQELPHTVVCVYPEVWITAGVLKALHKSVGVDVSGSSCFVLNQSSRFRV